MNDLDKCQRGLQDIGEYMDKMQAHIDRLEKVIETQEQLIEDLHNEIAEYQL